VKFIEPLESTRRGEKENGVNFSEFGGWGNAGKMAAGGRFILRMRKKNISEFCFYEFDGAF